MIGGFGLGVCMGYGVTLGEFGNLSLRLLLRWKCSVVDVSCFR